MSIESLAVEHTNPAFYIEGINPSLIYHPETVQARWAHYALAKRDFYYFSTHCCGFRPEPFHMEWIDATEAHSRVMVMCAREHAKTTKLNIIRNLWKLVHYNAYQIYMYSATGKLSSQLLDRHNAFMDLPYFNDPLIFNCDLLKNRRKRNGWNSEQHTFGNGSFLIAMGFESATRGPHPHDVICDDILSDRLKLTTEGVKKLFREAISNMPLKRLIVVGTPQHRNDILHDLMNNPVYHSKKYPAIIDTRTKTVLWEKVWNWDKLMLKKDEIGELAFSQEYLCNPIDDSASLFPRELMEACFDFVQYPKPKLTINLGEPYDPESQYAIGVDLAVGLTKKASFSVITVLQRKVIEDKTHFIIADIQRYKTDRLRTQVENITKAEDKYHPILTHVENNAFQKYIEQIIQDEKVYTTVKGFKTGSQKHHLQIGVPSLRQRFENKTFIIPRGMINPQLDHNIGKTEETIKLTNELLNELVDFTEKDGKVESLGTHTDMVMSLWMALSAMREIDKNQSWYGWLE
jgi:hypothetical protein